MKQLRIFNVTLCDYGAPTAINSCLYALWRCASHLYTHRLAALNSVRTHMHIMSIVMVYEIAFECYRLNRYIIRQLHKDMKLN